MTDKFMLIIVGMLRKKMLLHLYIQAYHAKKKYKPKTTVVSEYEAKTYKGNQSFCHRERSCL